MSAEPVSDAQARQGFGVGSAVAIFSSGVTAGDASGGEVRLEAFMPGSVARGTFDLSFGRGDRLSGAFEASPMSPCLE